MQKNNQNWAEKIRSTQFLKHVAFFGLGCLSWLGFSYLFVLYSKIPKGRSIYDFPWSYDAPIWSFGFCLVGACLTIFTKWAFELLTEKSKNIFRDFVILLCLIPINSLLITAFTILVLGITNSGGERPVEWDWVMGFLSEFISQTFVVMTCIGYFYLNLVNQTKERLQQAQEAKTAMELKTLQQNIEPHFLFNNLNVLSSLIESNPAKANDFLSKLSELYRYILQTQTMEVVPIKDELTFAENYVYLLQERFGDAYNFSWEVPENKLNGQKIVPVALQTLIENAVKHNAGNAKEPLQISIKLDENFVTVENDLREKLQTRITSQTGLQNLKKRYAFLTDTQIEIVQNSESFTVKLPLIQTQAETRA
ncbi:MAG: histidine kinase [Pyrinomonadaceae bacterium]|nr:histidine kinase [Pyrinomonadaceae bacterium]